MRKTEPTPHDIIETQVARIAELGNVLKQAEFQLDRQRERTTAAEKLASALTNGGAEWKTLADTLRVELEASQNMHRAALAEASFWRGVACGIDAEKAKAAAAGRMPPLQRANQTPPTWNGGDLYSDRF